MPGKKPKEREKYVIRIDDQFVEVIREVYLCYHQHEHRWRYQEERKAANNDSSFEGLTEHCQNRFGCNSSGIGEVIADRTADVWEQIEKRMEIEALYKALLKISEVHREVIRSLYLEGMSQKDCAKCLGLCRNSVAKYERGPGRASRITERNPIKFSNSVSICAHGLA